MQHYVTAKAVSEYLRFRFYQLRSIEAQLGDITTIRNQWKALNKNETVSFKGIEDKFSIRPSAKGSSSSVEERLPVLVATFWVLIFLSGITIIVLHLLGVIQ